jgi:hypothetical protein
MHPELEDFLNSAFASIQPTSSEIGRVVVEPDYEVEPSEPDASGLKDELLAFLREQSPDTAALTSRDGFEAKIPSSRGLLTQYIRKITLHQDKLDGSWVEVAPPGNWI